MPKQKPARCTESALPDEYTQVENARSLVRLHGTKIRYCYDLGCWYVWDDTRWRQDSDGEVERLCKSVADQMLDEAKDMTDSRGRTEALKWAARTHSGFHLNSMADLAKSERPVPVFAKDLDADPNLLNCKNGTIDLATSELHPHRKSQLLTRQANASFEPGAPCPVWEDSISTIFGGDAELIAYFQRVCGYSLLGVNGEQVMFLLYGSGANGKSTVVEAISDVLGDYSQQAPSELLLSRRKEGASPELARIRGKRLVVAVETDSGRKLDESGVKQMTGGDTLVARGLYEGYVEFSNHASICLVTNHLPDVSGTDEAIWRRLQLVPFLVTIPKEERDMELPTKLQSESDGILAWMVAGLDSCRERGLDPPEAAKLANTTYQNSMDRVGPFLDACCDESEAHRISSTALYEAYLSWADEQDTEPASRLDFSKALKERGLEKRLYGPDRTMHWIGIALRDREP